MITYVLIATRYFGNRHPRSGEPTFFREKIISAIGGYNNKLGKLTGANKINPKIHTIRANYKLWKERLEKVQAGEAIISVREWSGQAYKSKQIEFAQLDKDSGCGVQELIFINGDINKPTICGDRLPKPSWYKGINLIELAQNDGLYVHDFRSWFKDYKMMEYNQPKSFAIIHFTKFRY